MENGLPPEWKREWDFRYDIRNSLNNVRRPGEAVTELYEWIESCVLAIVVILTLFTFALRTATVSGPSMAPTLHDGDRLILMQAGYNDPQYGDIVVIDRAAHGQPPIIKRVIGRAGDEIDIDFDTGEVRRNGVLLDEPYINEPTYINLGAEFPAVVPEGHIFVLGDNRNHSSDSRDISIGMVDLRQVMGRAVFRFFPVGAAGALTD